MNSPSTFVYRRFRSARGVNSKGVHPQGVKAVCDGERGSQAPVALFRPQNKGAFNSYLTAEDLEIGSAQAFQAFATHTADRRDEPSVGASGRHSGSGHPAPQRALRSIE